MFYSFLFILSLIVFPLSLFVACMSTRAKSAYPGSLKETLDALRGIRTTWPLEFPAYCAALVSGAYLTAYLIN